MADDGLLRFLTIDGQEIFVEISSGLDEYRAASRKRPIIDAEQTFEAVLARVNTIATRTMQTMVTDPLRPDEIEIEFGVTFNAETGVAIAKAAVGSQVSVKLRWRPT